MITSKYNLIAIFAVTTSLLVSSAALAGGGTSHKPSKGTAPGVANAINNANKFGVSSTTAIGNPGLSNSINNVNKFGGNNISTVYGTGGGFTITHGGGKLPNEPGNNPNSGSGFTITHGGGKLPNEPGNNLHKGCEYDDCKHDCHNYCRYDYCRSDCYSSFGCSEMCGPMLVNSYIVLPGDTFDSISMKVYGVPSSAGYIAMYNHLPVNVMLVPGQRLMLPALSPISTLSASLTPVATLVPVAAN